MLSIAIYLTEIQWPKSLSTDSTSALWLFQRTGWRRPLGQSARVRDRSPCQTSALSRSKGISIRGNADTKSSRKVLKSSPWARHLTEGPARRHGLHNVPKTWVTLLDRTDFRAVRALASPYRSTPDHNP